jgi:hypothetical protein
MFYFLNKSNLPFSMKLRNQNFQLYKTKHMEQRPWVDSVGPQLVKKFPALILSWGIPVVLALIKVRGRAVKNN